MSTFAPTGPIDACLSVVVACYHEEATAERLIRRPLEQARVRMAGDRRVAGMRPMQTAFVRTYEHVVVLIPRVIESRVRPPFGHSVVSVSRRPRFVVY
jgi:hypothetical protein